MSVNIMLMNMYAAIVSVGRCILNGAVTKKANSVVDTQLMIKRSGHSIVYFKRNLLSA